MITLFGQLLQAPWIGLGRERSENAEGTVINPAHSRVFHFVGNREDKHFKWSDISPPFQLGVLVTVLSE